MNKILVTLSLLLASLMLQAQEYNLGIRAGLNYSKFLGPTVSEGAVEAYDFSSGFHFGITFDYNFTDIVSLKTEFLYIQNGTGYTYKGDSYYRIRMPDDRPILVERGQSDMVLDISNAYLSIPVMMSTKLGPKFELFGGLYGNVLIQPTAGGTLQFDSDSRPDEILFKQSLDYNYRTDQAQGGANATRPIGIIVDGEKVYFQKIGGAYFQYEPKERGNSLINGLDVGAVAGLNYYFNRGFYVSGRVNYGLLDLTDSTSDRDLQELNEDGGIVYRDDFDRHFGLQLSCGFKF